MKLPKGMAKEEDMTDEIRVGDRVRYREDRPSPDVRNVGKIGLVVDPGIPPPFPTHMWVEFPGEPEKTVDRSALMKVAATASIAADDLNASNDE